MKLQWPTFFVLMVIERACLGNGIWEIIIHFVHIIEGLKRLFIMVGVGLVKHQIIGVMITLMIRFFATVKKNLLKGIVLMFGLMKP